MSDFVSLWAELTDIGRAPSGGYRRFAWTREDAQLRAWFARTAKHLGLAVSEDRAGNQWAWWEVASSQAESPSHGTPLSPDMEGVRPNTPPPGLVIGSHLDSVPDGGAFDGPLGVVSAFAAVAALKEAGFVPAVPIGVVNFSDEEGARFGIACLGSRVLTGVVGADRALALTDDRGVTLHEAIRATGRHPDDFGPDSDALARVGAYLELHIEQGRHLVDVGQPLAVADEIWPHGRWRIDLPGRADHAGTTRMGDRSDALVGFAAVVLEARWAAAQHDAVATIGKLRVIPGGVNAIPSHVTGWLDARAPDEAKVTAMVHRVTNRVAELGGTITLESWTPPTPFDPGLRDRLAALLDAPVIGTGAGHDAGILANAGIPAAMIFVRNPTGTSHSPEEAATQQDCLRGVAALTQAIRVLASPSEGV